MAFTLKSQSPLNQSKDPYITSRLKAKSQKGTSTSFEDYGNKHPIIKAAVQLADPTGITSHGDVKKAWNDNKIDYKDVTEPLGAIPLIGKIPKVVKTGLNLAKSISTISKIAKAGSDINKVTSKVNKASKIANQEKLGEAIVTSPLQKQKLSPKAAKAKAVRDLAAAKTDDRRIKKAHSQRMHRKNPGSKGKDYDHEDGRFESVKQNRGNEGEGTKKESGKKYKVN
jgi:hypothetical protein